MSSRQPDHRSQSLAEIEAAERIRAKAILAELVRLLQTACQGIPTRLHLTSAFYLAHLYYAREREVEYLSVWPILQGAAGPEVAELQLLLDELVAEGRLECLTVDDGPFKEFAYASKNEPSEPFSDSALASMKSAVGEFENKPAEAVASYIREHSHSWKNALPGEELIIYVDLLPERQFKALASATEKNAAILRTAISAR